MNPSDQGGRKCGARGASLQGRANNSKEGLPKSNLQKYIMMCDHDLCWFYAWAFIIPWFFRKASDKKEIMNEFCIQSVLKITSLHPLGVRLAIFLLLSFLICEVSKISRFFPWFMLSIILITVAAPGGFNWENGWISNFQWSPRTKFCLRRLLFSLSYRVHLCKLLFDSASHFSRKFFSIFMNLQLDLYLTLAFRTISFYVLKKKPKVYPRKV